MKQATRLILTLLFLFLLLILSRILSGTWFYWPSGDQAIWFQSGLLMVVLGSFFIEKHFTKPVDVVANTIAGIVALLSVSRRDQFIFWSTVIWSMVALGAMAFLSMAIQSFSTSPRVLRLGRVLFNISTFFGNAKRLFSVVFVLSIFSFFQIPSKESLLLFLFWAVVVVAESVGIPNMLDRIVESIKGQNLRTGRLFKVLGASVFQIEVLKDVMMSEGQFIQINTPHHKLFCFPVDLTNLTDKRVITAIALNKAGDLDELVSSLPEDTFADCIPLDRLPENIKASRAFIERSHILGIVDDNSDIEQLRFQLFGNHDLQEGQLVKAFFADKPVLYQIVNAITASTSTEGDQKGFIRVIAQLVGVWDSADCHFESIGWVAEPGSLVFAELTDGSEISLGAASEGRVVIGRLPKSAYPIHVGISDIVTHHSAILGITGSGKTVLAYQLIRKMVELGIKVLVFDISADYARDLAGVPGLTKLSTSGAVAGFLASTNNLGIAEFAPTSAATIVKATAAAVQEVLKWAKTNLVSQHGENIEAKVCVVFEEAHSLIPEWNSISIQGDKEEVNKISQAILQGRKYGVGALVITQRTANITKTILNQCNTIFALQSFDQTGLDFLKNYIGEGHAHALSTLLKRQVVVFGKASSSRRPVIAKLNETPIAPPTQAGSAIIADTEAEALPIDGPDDIDRS
jgi:hypothetical protein